MMGNLEDLAIETMSRGLEELLEGVRESLEDGILE